MSGWTPRSPPATRPSSGGEQQRVGVARALAADPPILLMDEPFSAVDPVVRHELQNEILRLQAELHKTIVFVTHDIDEALKLADLVAVFAPGGALAQYDETARLLSSPANDFVSKFIGLGRGYRWLQLFDAAGLPVRDIEQVSVNGLPMPGTGKFVTAGCWWSTVRVRRWAGSTPMAGGVTAAARHCRMP